MSDIYKVILRPLSHYFFGGENGLGSGDSRNYLVVSRKWPQQSSLLGMVRYLLLKEKGWLSEGGKAVPKEAASLIGKRSFHLEREAESFPELDFGAVEKLGPLYLLKEGELYSRSALNHPYPLQTAKPVETEAICYGMQQAQSIYTLNGFEAKKGLFHGLYNHSSKASVSLDKEDPFISEQQIGIEKSRDGKSNDQSFYKQTYYRLAEGWSFCFYLKLKAGTEIPAKTELPFGGERCLFSWQAEKVAQEAQVDSIPSTEALNSLILLSDALVEANILEACHFGVIETQDFRCLTTFTEETENYSDLGSDRKQKSKVTKSQKYNMLKAGSVLYPKDMEAVKSQLDKARLQQIGYNHYYTKTSNSLTQ